MTFKNKSKSNARMGTISTSSEFCQNKYANGNCFNNPARNNRGRFATTNRAFNQRTFTNVSCL